MLSKGIQITDDTLKAIGEFCINWSVFEFEHCNNEASVKKLRDLNIRQVNNEQALLKSIAAFRNELCNFFTKRDLKIDDDSIKYCLYTEVSQQRLNKSQDDIALIKSFLHGYSDDYHIALLCVQRIRNNFFHGTKEFFHLDDQRALFESASNLLYCLC